jgi:enoyl-CoA hydratase
MWETVTMEVQQGIAIVKINRPKQLNALNEQVLRDLGACVDHIKNEQASIDVVILTGEGDRAFVAGADIAFMANLTPLEAIEFSRLGQATFRHLAALPQPVIAAINGFALGGGNELSMCCDIRIASDKAKFGQPEVGLGIIPGYGGTQRLPRLIGLGLAKYLNLSADIIDAETALRWGLVEFVVPAAELMDRALAMARKIQQQRKFAVRQVKLCIRRGLEAPLATALEFETEAFGMCFTDPDQKEAMTAFVNKSKK